MLPDQAEDKGRTDGVAFNELPNPFHLGFGQTLAPFLETCQNGVELPHVGPA